MFSSAEGRTSPVSQVIGETARPGGDWSIIAKQLLSKQEEEAEMENTLRQ